MKKIIYTTISVLIFSSLGSEHVLAQESYPTWKHELQALLGLTPDGNPGRDTFEALAAFAEEHNVADDALTGGYDALGGYLGFQIYLDNNKERLLDILRNPPTKEAGIAEEAVKEEEVVEEVAVEEAAEEEVAEEEEEGLGEPWYSAIIGGLSLRSTGIDLGFYKPAMDYWNEDYSTDTYLFPSGTTLDSKFGASLLAQANLKINLNSAKTIRAHFQIGYWKGTAKLTDVTYDNADGTSSKGTEEISISLIPMTMSIVYELPALPIPFVGEGLYAGAGWGTNSITKEVTQSPTGQSAVTDTDSGSGPRYHIVIGTERPLSGNLTMGGEFRYSMGKYTQEFAKTNTFDKDISISGPQFLLSLNYLFSK